MALKKLAKAEAALSSVSSKSLKLRATTDLKEQAKVHIVHSCVGRAKANAVFGSSHQAS